MSIYDYQRLVGKIEDITELRNEFIVVFDTKDKNEVARFGLKYAKHILEITGFEVNNELLAGFEAVQEWIDGKTNYHKARNIAFTDLYKEVRESNDLIKKNFVKTMAQLICIPHVKAHGLWGSDMAITLINAMYPNNLDKVKEEREIQIKLLECII
jgi:hypothetical protein